MKSRPKNLWIFENVQSPRAILVFLLNLDYVKIKQLPYMIISVKKPVKKPVQCMQTTHRSLETVRTERRWNDTYEKAQHFLNVATILWLGHKNWCWMLSMHPNWKHWLKLCHFHDGKSQISITSNWEDIGSTVTKKREICQFYTRS